MKKLVAGVALLTAIVVGEQVLAGSSGHAGNAAKAAPAVAPEIGLSQAAAVARRVARDAGDSTATVDVGSGAMPTGGLENGPVYNVLMKGTFTLNARVPRGQPAPTGTTLQLQIDRATGQVVGVRLTP